MSTSESSQLALEPGSDWRELASRETDGLAVTLLWSTTSNQVKVAVADSRLDETFEVEVGGADALAAFYHPFSFAARKDAAVSVARRAIAWPGPRPDSRARVLEAERRERRRLERDLHDGAQQRLIALSLELKRLEQDLSEHPAACSRLDRVQREIDISLDELRAVARGLHPAVLSDHGLAVALDQAAALAPVPVRVSVEMDERLPEHVEVAAYFVVTESLSNIAKHARATKASVEVVRSDRSVLVEIVDDGVGGADTRGGTGLRGIADRVEAVRGRLCVSSPLGLGTQIRAEIPCA